jgi:hypothetical protein
MKPITLHLLYGCLAVALSQSAFAQSTPPCTEGQPASDCKSQPPNPPRPSAEEMQKSMDAAMGSMVPMMGRMTEVTIEAQLKLAAMPETAERIAAFKKNLFDQLQKKGFTPAQALQITLSTPLPSASSGK